MAVADLENHRTLRCKSQTESKMGFMSMNKTTHVIIQMDGTMSKGYTVRVFSVGNHVYH